MRLPRSSPLRLTFLLAATAAAALALLACSSPAESTPTEGSSSPDATQPAGSASPTTSEAATGEGRPFAMGFTPYPHDGALPGLQDALAIIEDEGDLAAMHFDGGVPWLEALSGDPWPDPYRAEVEGKAGAIPGGHLVYLAVTPISFERDALAPYAGPGGVGPLPPPWDGYAFNSPEVIEAYGNFVLRMVDLYHPDYLAYAIEPNLFADNRPDQWPALVDLAAATYATVKQAHPDLPTFVSIQAEWYHRAPATQAALIAGLLPYTDLIAVSAYPYIDGLTAAAMPDAYFEDLRALAPDKPFAVAETGWPAEPVGAPTRSPSPPTRPPRPPTSTGSSPTPQTPRPSSSPGSCPATSTPSGRPSPRSPSRLPPASSATTASSPATAPSAPPSSAGAPSSSSPAPASAPPPEAHCRSEAPGTPP